MSNAAAFKGTYADWRLIKTRGVVSICFEVPLNEADAAYQVLGGMPDSAKEQWFGIAALNLGSSSTVERHAVNVDAAGSSPASLAKLNGEPASNGNGPVEAAGPCGDTPDRPHSPRKPVAAEKRLAQQAGICCSEPMFWRFLEDECHYGIANEADASDATRELCGVKSRTEFIPGTPAGNSWSDLHGRFLAWKMVPA